MAVTFAVLQSFGTVPVSKLLWKIADRYGDNSAASSFRILAGSRSGTEAFPGFSFCSSFVMHLVPGFLVPGFVPSFQIFSLMSS